PLPRRGFRISFPFPVSILTSPPPRPALRRRRRRDQRGGAGGQERAAGAGVRRARMNSTCSAPPSSAPTSQVKPDQSVRAGVHRAVTEKTEASRNAAIARVFQPLE